MRVRSDLALNSDIMTLTKLISGGDENVIGCAILLAEAEIDLRRIRAVRNSILTVFYEGETMDQASWVQLDEGLSKLERYEQRAITRRKRAMKGLVLHHSAAKGERNAQ